ncbi:MAG: hypothetical protein MR051_08665 [Lentisphaeria bacterium]|nr:hypothetical protein [Lentisphaeria bacterium]
MKKFLRIPIPAAPEIPPALDRRILAAAALRAHGLRQRRRVLRFVLPATAAMLMTGLTFFAMSPDVPVTRSDATAKGEMLALADMTALEQGNFALASMSEFELFDDCFTI